jgi:hypothetical protein
MRRLALVGAVLLAVGGCRPCLQSGVGECAALRAVNPAALRATTWLLDEEAFGRREVPAPGALHAAHLVAAQLQALGLAPGGDHGTFLQEVPITVDETRKPALTLVQGAVETTLAHERDYQVLQALGDTQAAVDAELALADLDGATPAGWMRGRVAVVPVPGPQDAARAADAVRRLRAGHAAGVILCTRGPGGRDAYHKLREQLTRPMVRLAGEPRSAPQDGRLVLALAPPACELLLATAAAGRPTPAAGPVLPLRVRAQVTIQPKPARAWNAVGVYRTARDPAAAPYVVAARLDGPGLDVAALLEIGRVLVQLQARPRQPVVLAALASGYGAPVGFTQLGSGHAARRAAHVHNLFRVKADQAPAAVARLVDSIMRGAAPAPAP